MRRNALPETCDIALLSSYEITWIGIGWRIAGPCPNLHGRGNVPHVDIEPFKQDRGAPGQDCKSVAVRIRIIVGTIERRPEEQTSPSLDEAQKENDCPKKPRHALIAGCHVYKEVDSPPYTRIKASSKAHPPASLPPRHGE